MIAMCQYGLFGQDLPPIVMSCRDSIRPYFRMRRLYRAYSALGNHAYRSGNLAQIAKNHGFRGLGRFTAEYQRLYGESPSVILEAV